VRRLGAALAEATAAFKYGGQLSQSAYREPDQLPAVELAGQFVLILQSRLYDLRMSRIGVVNRFGSQSFHDN
jgi:hypothetical protein